ncbi:MAG: 2-oxoglutarate dehydrogenase E1 component [Polyangiaceae bacterium]|nr:2-oxoglutarate dehydrogenase E1 component [Polyangiaceae bacterium]
MIQPPHPNDASLPFVEQLYEAYLRDPFAVPGDWRDYFAALPAGGVARLGPTFEPRSVFNPRGGAPEPTRHSLVPGLSDAVVLQDRVDQLIRAYRVRGHMIAEIDPLGLPRPMQPELRPSFYDLGAYLDHTFSARTIQGAAAMTLRDILLRLRATYCRSIGVQFMHIDDLTVKSWLQERMEGTENRIRLSHDEQLRILRHLTEAVTFEEFTRKKYQGKKTFSLEGSESLVPLLAVAIDHAAGLGVDEIVLGMAHRGRLNVLANILGKKPRDIFREFDDADAELYLGSGDVKYHLGYSSDWRTPAGRDVHLTLCFNPSHLEYVNTVVLGRARAKQDRARDAERARKLAVLIHGDAAFAGEGIVQETLNLSELDAYQVGGTLHVVVNNQIGFTTPPGESRSQTYATDVAKMLQIPIFHVNGEDPEAVASVVRLALDFRQRFRKDVVIDVYGYRRLGHNEGDEPAFTQPVLYRAIRERPSARESYVRQLIEHGEVTQDEADRVAVEARERLERDFAQARAEGAAAAPDWLGGLWRGYVGGADDSTPDVETAVPEARLASLLARQTELPADFHPHRTLERLLHQRREMAEGARPLDWGAAEALALATLVTEGVRVRLTGQDSARGTFSHRHAVLHDVEDGHKYMPLLHLEPGQAPIEVYNSPLSEAGVLGFEYGYSLDWPDALVAWEAQFGDFANCAQVIIDQFISSAEDKWKRLSGIVLLLPHGFEGQGPEHSSARLERFMMLTAEHNLQVTQPTTPAQLFHLLRRQVHRKWRKPLVVLTPKSLLRLPAATSALAELATGRFERILADTRPAPRATRAVLLCSGRVYYDLEQRRAAAGHEDVAILRVEQLYPLGDDVLLRALARYADGTPVRWVQDEPDNMGAWRLLRYRLGERILGRFPLAGVCRDESASPATGSPGAHELEQRRLLEAAFA